MVCFEGQALMWWENPRNPVESWGDLRSMILRHFRPSDEGAMYVQWLAVEQHGSVAEYRRDFADGVTHLDMVPEAVLIRA